jgi:hypothetical protein
VKRPCDTLVAPTLVFAGHAKNQIHDLLIDGWPTNPVVTRLETAVWFDEFSVPPEDGVCLSNRRHLRELRSSKRFSLNRQKATLVIIQQHSVAADLLAKDLVLELNVLDDQLLLRAYVLNEGDDENMERLEKK